VVFLPIFGDIQHGSTTLVLTSNNVSTSSKQLEPG